MGGRTNPTVKSSPVMNKKNLERKEVRLGIIQVVSLLGLTIGSLAGAFCLGFFVGQRAGFEREISSMMASLPKFPVSSDVAGSDVDDQALNEVYAKLQEQTSPGDGQTDAKGNSSEVSAVPELGSIQETEPQKDQPLDPLGETEGELMPQNADENAAPVADLEEQKKLMQENLGQPSDSKNRAGKIESLGSTLPDKESAESIKIEEPKKPESKSVVTEIVGSKKPEKELEKKPLAETQKIENVSEKVKEEPKPLVKTPVTEASNVKPQKKIPGGWFAQVAAPKQIDDANKLANNLKQSGFAVMIEAAQVRGEDYFRVLVGPEGSKSQAEILLRQLKRESYIKGEPFIRMVK